VNTAEHRAPQHGKHARAVGIDTHLFGTPRPKQRGVQRSVGLAGARVLMKVLAWTHLKQNGNGQAGCEKKIYISEKKKEKKKKKTIHSAVTKHR
jgi:hypothetical protein